MTGAGPDAAAPRGETVRVTTAYRAHYADPIAVRAGERLRFTGRVDRWEAWRWLWAVGPDGREGWVPDDLVAGAEALAGKPFEAAALGDYSAAELTCAQGEALTVVERRHGWALCMNALGRRGWVPLGCFDG